MKKFIASLALLGLITTVSGCRTSTSYGQCKGFVNKDEKDPNLNYEVSIRNIVVAGIFSASLAWPAVTGAFFVWCPTSRK